VCEICVCEANAREKDANSTEKRNLF
jgi:hypothetical protein